jgi:peroxiredoxin
MTRSRSLQVLIVLALCVLLLALVAPASPRATAVVAAGPGRQMAPDFSTIDAAGTRVRLSGLKGRVVLLDFWATWCTGCKLEIPWFVEFQEKYRGLGLVSVGVAMDDEGWPVVRPFLSEHPIPYPIVLGTHGIGAAFTIQNLPVTLLIDRRGAIADSHLGVVDKAAWEQQIVALLREPA